MSDVRLTALDPSDSSVVPVACNDKGELLLQDPPTFDGNLDGNLSVSGNATFQGGYATDHGTDISGGGFYYRDDSGGSSTGVHIFAGGTSSANEVISLAANGSASFAGGATTISASGAFTVKRAAPTNDCFTGMQSDEITSHIKASGSAQFGGEVTVTSNSQQWVLTEVNGICHMVSASLMDDPGFSVNSLRDVFGELDELKSLVQTIIKSRKESD